MIEYWYLIMRNLMVFFCPIFPKFVLLMKTVAASCILKIDHITEVISAMRLIRDDSMLRKAGGKLLSYTIDIPSVLFTLIGKYAPEV